jgi:hypothetical protein
MAISIDWISRVISVPQADLTMLSATEYELDTDAFHITLRDLEASEPGAPWPTTHTHNTEAVLGGITFARLIEIIGGYTVTFENGSYAVTLVGSNNNILDVANLNSVSIRPTNSAGLIVTDTSGLTAAEAAQLQNLEKWLRNKMVTDPVTGKLTLYDDDDTTPLWIQNLFEDAAGSTPYSGGGVERRDRAP